METNSSKNGDKRDHFLKSNESLLTVSLSVRLTTLNGDLDDAEIDGTPKRHFAYRTPKGISVRGKDDGSTDS